MQLTFKKNERCQTLYWVICLKFCNPRGYLSYPHTTLLANITMIYNPNPILKWIFNHPSIQSIKTRGSVLWIENWGCELTKRSKNSSMTNRLVKENLNCLARHRNSLSTKDWLIEWAEILQWRHHERVTSAVGEWLLGFGIARYSSFQNHLAMPTECSSHELKSVNI